MQNKIKRSGLPYIYLEDKISTSGFYKKTKWIFFKNGFKNTFIRVTNAREKEDLLAKDW